MKRIAFGWVGLLMLSLSSGVGGQTRQIADVNVDAKLTSPQDSPRLPPVPHGTSTIVGGAIGDVDPVLDRFTLRVVGGKPMKILFDERTQVYLNGKRIPLNQLRPSDHASVQTMLDGTTIFAVSVHILSQLQEGDYRGQVVSYEPTTGDLELVSGKGGDPIRMRVTGDTKFEREGQSSFRAGQTGPEDLQPGALVSVKFEPDGKGHGIATQLTFFATRGSSFVFSGNLVGLDMHAGFLMLLDPTDNRSYQIDFNPGAISSIQNIHSGQRVRITAEYDGARYLAHDIAPY